MYHLPENSHGNKPASSLIPMVIEENLLSPLSNTRRFLIDNRLKPRRVLPIQVRLCFAMMMNCQQKVDEVVDDDSIRFIERTITLDG